MVQLMLLPPHHLFASLKSRMFYLSVGPSPGSLGKEAVKKVILRRNKSHNYVQFLIN